MISFNSQTHKTLKITYEIQEYIPTLTSGSGPSAAREKKCVCAFLSAELFYFSPNKVKFPLFQSFIANDKIAYITCSTKVIDHPNFLSS